MELFKCSVSFWVSCGSLCFLRNWSISSKLINLCVYSCSWQSLTILWCLQSLWWYPDISNLWLIPFFVVNLARDLSILLIFPKSQLFCSLIFFYCFSFFSMSLISVFIISFCLPWVYLLFSSFLRWKFIDLRLCLFPNVCI